MNIQLYTQRGEKYLGRGIIFQKKKEKKKNPNPILSSKEVVATLSSFLFKKKRCSCYSLKKKKTEITLLNESRLSISPSHRPSRRGPPLTSKSHHISFHPVLQERPSSFFFFLLVQRTSSRCPAEQVTRSDLLVSPFLFSKKKRERLMIF